MVHWCTGALRAAAARATDARQLHGRCNGQGQRHVQAVRAERAVQNMAQIMPRASLLAAVARLRRGVVVVLVA